MKKFKGSRTLAEVREQCLQQGLTFDDAAYERGADHIVIGLRGEGYVLWSAWTGKFCGITPEGVKFDSDSAEHDEEPWMQALLLFFYVPEEEIKNDHLTIHP